MRITIETENEGRIILEPEKMGSMETQLQASQEDPLDGGGPSDELMNAIAGSAASFESDEMEAEEGEDMLSMEDSSAFH